MSQPQTKGNATWTYWALRVQTAVRCYGPHDVYLDGAEVIVRRVDRARLASPVPDTAELLGRYEHPLSRANFYDDLRAAGVPWVPNKGGRSAVWPSRTVAGYASQFRKAVNRDACAEFVWLPSEGRLMVRRPLPRDAVVVGVFDKTAPPDAFVAALVAAVPQIGAMK